MRMTSRFVNDPDKLERMVTVLHIGLKQWGYLMRFGKTKSMTVYLPKYTAVIPALL